MAARLLIMNEEFFADFAANTQDMQFSGDNREALTRLKKLAKDVFPQRWSDLVRWPVLCDCGHAMEFAVLYYIARMKCPICHTDVGVPGLHQRLTEQDDDRARYHMLIATINANTFVFGEEACQALRALVRMTDDRDTICAAAGEMSISKKYERRGDS